jgi:hypothetical protein
MTEKRKPCPICGRQPEQDQTGVKGWLWIGCGADTIGHHDEHWVGANGKTVVELTRNWNSEVEKQKPAQPRD